LSISNPTKPIDEKTALKKRKQTRVDLDASTKIIVRNIPFQASKHEIRDLFKNFGELKSVRLPKKMNGEHRGFAFIEFVSVEEAKNAYSSLFNTHLYGRKLNLEFSQDDNETLEKLEKKTRNGHNQDDE